MRLSENFSLKEFLVSDSFPEIAARMKPDDYAISALTRLCVSVLQPIRDKWGPVKINSGYRSRELLEAMSAKYQTSKTSQHCHGEAADIVIQGKYEAYLFNCFKWIVEESGIPVHQAILYIDEFDSPPSESQQGPTVKRFTFIHVSIMPLDGRDVKKKILVNECGKYISWEEWKRREGVT